MKKFLCAFVAAICTFGSAFAAPGDILGNVLKTDIASYINNYPIKSYNINGSTAVLVEDLKHYGFDAVWDGNTRSVHITRNKAWEITPDYVFYRYPLSLSGQFDCYYYDTDIVTYLDGEKITSFNIGGKTAVYLSSLQKYGNLLWDQDKREAHITIDSVKSCTYSPVYTIYPSEFKAPMIENVCGALSTKISDNIYRYNMTEISVQNFSDYTEVLKKCGFYYMEWKSSQDSSIYFTDDKTVIRFYYSSNNLFAELSQAN